MACSPPSPLKAGELCFSTQPPRPASSSPRERETFTNSLVMVTFSELVSTSVLKSSYKAPCQSRLHCSMCAQLSLARSCRSWICRWGHLPCHWPAAQKENVPFCHGHTRNEREGAFCAQVLGSRSSVRPAGVYRACLGRREGEEPGCQPLDHCPACSLGLGPEGALGQERAVS